MPSLTNKTRCAGLSVWTYARAFLLQNFLGPASLVETEVVHCNVWEGKKKIYAKCSSYTECSF